MNKLLKGTLFLVKSSHFERLRLIRIVYLIFKAYFFVTFKSPKRYFNIYCFGTSRKDSDMQPFRKDIVFIKKVAQSLPIRITCLMESMAIQEYLQQYDFLTPISLGVKRSGSLSAHAWISQSNAAGYINIFK